MEHQPTIHFGYLFHLVEEHGLAVIRNPLAH
jgi:hypothetical protein